jgi:hypothetical protein
MKATFVFLVKLFLTLVLLGMIAFVFIKYLDEIVTFCNMLRRKICNCVAKCGRRYDADNDIDISEICLDVDCACGDAE